MSNTSSKITEAFKAQAKKPIREMAKEAGGVVVTGAKVATVITRGAVGLGLVATTKALGFIANNLVAGYKDANELLSSSKSKNSKTHQQTIKNDYK